MTDIQITWWSNMVERLDGELRRRDRVIRIYPNAASAIRLMGAHLVEHDEKWGTKEIASSRKDTCTFEFVIAPPETE